MYITEHYIGYIKLHYLQHCLCYKTESSSICGPFCMDGAVILHVIKQTS